MKKEVLILIIGALLFIKKSYSQNLKSVLNDFGYGIDSSNKSLSDSVFSFNFFARSNDINFDLIYSCEDLSCNKIVDTGKEILQILSNGTILVGSNKYNINKLYDENQRFKKIFIECIYSVRLNSNRYRIIILSSRSSNSYFCRRRGLLLYDNKIIPFPAFQTTDSPLNIADFDCDGFLDYLSFNIYEEKKSNIVRLFTLRDGVFVESKKYKFVVNPLDGFLYSINFNKSLLPKCN